MLRFTANRLEAVLLKDLGQFVRDIGWAVGGRQARAMAELKLRDSAFVQGSLQGVVPIRRDHAARALPGQAIARQVVQDRRPVVPAPANDVLFYQFVAG